MRHLALFLFATSTPCVAQVATRPRPVIEPHVDTTTYADSVVRVDTLVRTRLRLLLIPDTTLRDTLVVTPRISVRQWAETTYAVDSVLPLFYDNHSAFLRPQRGTATSCRFDARGCNIPVTAADSAWLRLRPDLPDPFTSAPALELRFRSPSRAGGSKNVYLTRNWTRRATSWALRTRIRFNQFTTYGDDGTCSTCPGASYKMLITAPYLEPTGREGWIWADRRLFHVFNQGRSGSGLDSGTVSVNVHEAPMPAFWGLGFIPAWTNERWQDVVLGVDVLNDSLAVQFTYWTDADSLARGLLQPQLRFAQTVRIPVTRLASHPKRWRVVGTDTTFRSITGISFHQSANYNKSVVDAHDGMSILWGPEEVYDLDAISQPWKDYPDFYRIFEEGPYGSQASSSLSPLSHQGSQDLARWLCARAQAHQTPARVLRSPGRGTYANPNS